MINKDALDAFQIFNGTGTAVKAKPMTNSKLDKVSKANADTLEHYKQRQQAKNKTRDMIQQLNKDTVTGVPYCKLLVDALTIIEITTGDAIFPNQIKKAIEEREINHLETIAKQYEEEPTEEGRAVIERLFDDTRKDLELLETS